MREFSVMSFNIGHGETKAGTITLERTARLVEESGVSLVGLQEVDRFYPRSYFEDQARSLAKRLSMNYCFTAVGRRTGFMGTGLAILSRYPVIHHTSHRLEPPRPDRVLQRAAIDFDGIRITFLNASLKAAGPGARRSIEDICRNLRAPAILTTDAGPNGGSFGSTSPDWLWHDAKPGGGQLKIPLRHSRPQGGIFISPHWELIDCRVHQTGWSANWALSAVVGLRTHSSPDIPGVGDGKPVLVAPPGLGRIHGDIGKPDQVFKVLPVVGKDGDPYTGTEQDLFSGNCERLADTFDYFAVHGGGAGTNLHGKDDAVLSPVPGLEMRPRA